MRKSYGFVKKVACAAISVCMLVPSLANAYKAGETVTLTVDPDKYTMQSGNLDKKTNSSEMDSDLIMDADINGTEKIEISKALYEELLQFTKGDANDIIQTPSFDETIAEIRQGLTVDEDLLFRIYLDLMNKEGGPVQTADQQQSKTDDIKKKATDGGNTTSIGEKVQQNMQEFLNLLKNLRDVYENEIKFGLGDAPVYMQNDPLSAFNNLLNMFSNYINSQVAKAQAGINMPAVDYVMRNFYTNFDRIMVATEEVAKEFKEDIGNYICLSAYGQPIPNLDNVSKGETVIYYNGLYLDGNGNIIDGKGKQTGKNLITGENEYPEYKTYQMVGDKIYDGEGNEVGSINDTNNQTVASYLNWLQNSLNAVGADYTDPNISTIMALTQSTKKGVVQEGEVFIGKYYGNEENVKAFNEAVKKLDAMQTNPTNYGKNAAEFTKNWNEQLDVISKFGVIVVSGCDPTTLYGVGSGQIKSHPRIQTDPDMRNAMSSYNLGISNSSGSGAGYGFVKDNTTRGYTGESKNGDANHVTFEGAAAAANDSCPTSTQYPTELAVTVPGDPTKVLCKIEYPYVYDNATVDSTASEDGSRGRYDENGNYVPNAEDAVWVQEMFEKFTTNDDGTPVATEEIPDRINKCIEAIESEIPGVIKVNIDNGNCAKARNGDFKNNSNVENGNTVIRTRADVALDNLPTAEEQIDYQKQINENGEGLGTSYSMEDILNSEDSKSHMDGDTYLYGNGEAEVRDTAINNWGDRTVVVGEDGVPRYLDQSPYIVHSADGRDVNTVYKALDRITPGVNWEAIDNFCAAQALKGNVPIIEGGMDASGNYVVTVKVYSMEEYVSMANKVYGRDIYTNGHSYYTSIEDVAKAFVMSLPKEMRARMPGGGRDPEEALDWIFSNMSDYAPDGLGWKDTEDGRTDDNNRAPFDQINFYDFFNFFNSVQVALQTDENENPFTTPPSFFGPGPSIEDIRNALNIVKISLDEWRKDLNNWPEYPGGEGLDPKVRDRIKLINELVDGLFNPILDKAAENDEIAKKIAEAVVTGEDIEDTAKKIYKIMEDAGEKISEKNKEAFEKWLVDMKQWLIDNGFLKEDGKDGKDDGDNVLTVQKIAKWLPIYLYSMLGIDDMSVERVTTFQVTHLTDAYITGKEYVSTKWYATVGGIYIGETPGKSRSITLAVGDNEMWSDVTCKVTSEQYACFDMEEKLVLNVPGQGEFLISSKTMKGSVPGENAAKPKGNNIYKYSTTIETVTEPGPSGSWPVEEDEESKKSTEFVGVGSIITNMSTKLGTWINGMSQFASVNTNVSNGSMDISECYRID